MPILTTGLVLKALSATGAGLALSHWLRAPESHLDPSRLRWLDGVEWHLTPEEQTAIVGVDAVHNYQVLHGREPTLDETQVIWEGAQNVPEVEARLAESAADGAPTQEARTMHQEAAEALMPVRTGGRRRRIRRRALMSGFMRHWIARVRGRFPMREDRKSDRAAMLKWCLEEMGAQGIRPTHAENAAQLVVNLALPMSLAERMGRRMAQEFAPRTRGGRMLWNLRCRLERMFSVEEAPTFTGYDY